MSSMTKSSTGEVGAIGPARTLNSWKEIAFYLKREVRTVQRWEKNEGLPTRRHHHHKGCTVYAFKEEIDAWLRSREPQAVPKSPMRSAHETRINVSPQPDELLIAKCVEVFRSLITALLKNTPRQPVAVERRRAGKSVLGRARYCAHARFEPQTQLERVLLMPDGKNENSGGAAS